jgi:hypothetical protein
MAYSMSFDGPLLVIRLHGMVTTVELDTVTDEVIELEQGGTNAPPRMTDIRDVTDSNVRYPELAKIAERARTRPLAAPVRSAIVVAKPVQLGYARMFQTLNEHPKVTVRIFEDEPAARKWLAPAPHP